VAAALEALTVLAGSERREFVPSTPRRLRAARTCYDHMAGAVAVALHAEFLARAWLTQGAHEADYALSPAGTRAFESIGVDLAATRSQRRRFACACLDWSERRPHMAGALGAAFLKAVLKRRWLVKETEGRALELTPAGRRELRARFGLPVEL
jgi:hypothetical protein